MNIFTSKARFEIRRNKLFNADLPYDFMRAEPKRFRIRGFRAWSFGYGYSLIIGPVLLTVWL